LIARGAHVVAVEPVDGMRSQLEQAVPGAEALSGTAEAIPVPDGSAEAVTAAQAFHWFDHARALPEIHRVLAPGGGVALIWNVRDKRHAIQRALDELTEPLRGSNYPGGKHWTEVFADHALFAPLEDETFAHAHLLDRDGLVERVASISFVAALPQTERRRLLEQVRALAPAEGLLELPYLTRVYVSRRR
jgi:SAM-dependent methyltransferase